MDRHLVIVEAYDGVLELLSDAPEERHSARALGLPVRELAERLGCRITVLSWEKWLGYAWGAAPITRPVARPSFDTEGPPASSQVRRLAIPARDPVHRQPFDVQPASLRSWGLLTGTDLLYLAAYCLNLELDELHREDPFGAVVVPMWGGLGYFAQLARATRAVPRVDVPFAVVVTDSSANRQRGNQEGLWTRPAMTRRQMEDVSLALADLTVTFGPRGEEIATGGRAPDAAPPIRSARQVDETLLDAIERAARPSDAPGPATFFLHEPQEAASGVLVALDAVDLLRRRGARPARPVVSAGPSMTFAPMAPRDFVDYWGSRAFARELVRDGWWSWAPERPGADGLAVRVYPSAFEHLPNIWAELARGSLVVLSSAAAEGLGPGVVLPAEVSLGDEPTAERVADQLARLAAMEPAALDRIRCDLCEAVVAAHRGVARRRSVDDTAAALQRLLAQAPARQRLSQAALGLTDRRLPLRTVLGRHRAPVPPAPSARTKPGTLSVVVTCYEMGALLGETIRSVWASERRPDEVLLVDDGSQGAETLAEIQGLEGEAARGGLPLRVVRQGNRGLAGARNAGLEAATGEFISFLDGDDLIEPAFYRLALPLLAGDAGLGGVAAWSFIFGEEMPEGFWNAPQPEFPFLLTENMVIVPCVARTEVIRELGGYDVRQRYNYEDWELAIRLLASGRPIVTIPMYLQRYRVRGDSLLRTMSATQNQVMRELLLESHRELASRFGLELAMQVEHRLATVVHGSSQSVSPGPIARLVDGASGALAGASRRLRGAVLSRWTNR